MDEDATIKERREEAIGVGGQRVSKDAGKLSEKKRKRGKQRKEDIRELETEMRGG